MLFRRKPQAGVHAEQRYRQGLRSWRRKNRRYFALLCAPVIVVAMVVGISMGDLVAWSAGLAAGGFLTLWVVLRDTPPRYVETWRDGAEGERKAEKALRPLERAGWRVFHDVENGHGNYDHIAIGPSGVYLLDSKNLQGVASIKRGVPHLARRYDLDQTVTFSQVLPSALASARRLRDDLERRTGYQGWIQAVVVFWSEFPEGLVQERKCVFIEGPRLCEWLRSQPKRLDRGEVDRLAAAVSQIANDAASDGVGLVPAKVSPA